MSYSDVEMYDEPEVYYDDMGRYGARTKDVARRAAPAPAPGNGEGPKKAKKKTAKQLADSKGSARTVHTKHTVFRYAQIRRAVDEMIKKIDRSDDVDPFRITWSKPAVLMIATALEQKLSKILKFAHNITLFAKKNTVSVEAVERAAENDGIPTQVFRGACAEAEDAAEIAKRLRKVVTHKGDEELSPKDSRTATRVDKASRSRAEARKSRAKYDECADADFNHSKENYEFSLVATAVSRAAVKNMLTAVGAQRGSITRIHKVLSNIAYGFLHNVVRNIASVLELYHGTRVTIGITQPILQDFGFVSVGFGAISTVIHKKKGFLKNKRIEKKAKARLAKKKRAEAVADVDEDEDEEEEGEE